MSCHLGGCEEARRGLGGDVNLAASPAEGCMKEASEASNSGHWLQPVPLPRLLVVGLEVFAFCRAEWVLGLGVVREAQPGLLPAGRSQHLGGGAEASCGGRGGGAL